MIVTKAVLDRGTPDFPPLEPEAHGRMNQRTTIAESTVQNAQKTNG
jgi:hypothetical protein